MKTLSDVYTPKQLTSWRIRVETRRRVVLNRFLKEITVKYNRKYVTDGLMFFAQREVFGIINPTIDNLKLFLRVLSLDKHSTAHYWHRIGARYGKAGQGGYFLSQEHTELCNGKALKRAVKTKRRLNILQEL